VPWSWKSRAIPLLPLWAVRPVQSLSVCTRVHFSLPFFLKVRQTKELSCFYLCTPCLCKSLFAGCNIQRSDLLTYVFTPCSRVLLEKSTGCQHFMENRRYITTFASARHLSLSWARSVQSIPHPNSCKSFLILSSHPRLGLRKHKISDRKKSLRQQQKRFFESFTYQLFGQSRIPIISQIWQKQVTATLVTSVD